MFGWYLVLLLLAIAWVRIETRHAATSSGIASMIAGCLVFSFGLVGMTPHEKLYGWLLVAVGLFMALCGVARLVASMLQRGP